MFSKLLPRLVTGVIVLAVVLTLAWVEPLRPGFALLVVLFAGIGLYEFFTLAHKRGITEDGIGVILAGIILVASGYLADERITSCILLGAILIAMAIELTRESPNLAAIAASAFGIVYIGWFGAHLLFLHNDPDLGPGFVMILLVAIVLSDTGAYFAGNLFGKNKLAPKISPGKTREGAVGGLFLAMVGMGVIYAIQQNLTQPIFPDWSLTRYLVAGAALSVAGQLGDLLESAIKRDAGVKDSGTIFPGHGGMLDRCDSIIFAAPVLYYISKPLALSI